MENKTFGEILEENRLPESGLSDTMKELLEDLKKFYSNGGYNPNLDPYQSPFI